MPAVLPVRGAYPLSHMDLANSIFASIGPFLHRLSRSRRVREPRAWLAPLTPFYWCATRLHRLWMVRKAPPPQVPQIPLVVVGALRAGGSGKTSVTLELARQYRRRGLRVAILAYRLGPGTGGKGLLQEVGGDADWRIASDEAVLLRRQAGVPVFAVRNRLRAWRELESAGSGEGVPGGGGSGGQGPGNQGSFDLILSDDGFQDPRLRGAFNILLVGAGDRPGLLDLLPAGPFRETSAACSRADLVLEGPFRAPSGSGGPPVNLSVAGNAPVSFRFSRRLIMPGGADPAAAWTALCGLGDNRGFLADLADRGFVPKAVRELPDHAAATLPDLEALASGNPEAGILCSRKDFLKLEPGWAERFRIEPVDQEIFIDTGAIEAVDRYLVSFRARKGEFGTLSRLCVP